MSCASSLSVIYTCYSCSCHALKTLEPHFFYNDVSCMFWLWWFVLIYYFKTTIGWNMNLIHFQFILIFLLYLYGYTRLSICLAADCLFVLYVSYSWYDIYLPRKLFLIFSEVQTKCSFSFIGQIILLSWSIKELVRDDKNGLLFSSSSELADELLVSFLIITCTITLNLRHI